MASFTPTIPAPRPATSRGNRGICRPSLGGGDGGRRPDPGSPDYGARLRRARLGLAVALTPVTMLFVAFTSAYIVRQGLPTFDPHTNTVVHDWIPVPLPTVLFLINTCVLLFSSVTIEFARGGNWRGKWRSNPCGLFPGVSLGTEKQISLAGADHYSWLRFPGWTMAGLEGSGVAWVLRRHRPQQFFHLPADRRARRASARRSSGPAGSRNGRLVAPALGIAPDCG
jgi:hypothetical protein